MGDRDDITALVHGYAELLDRGDVDGVVAMFSLATWRSAATGKVLRTPDELRAVYSALVPDDGGPDRTRHLMHNLVVEHADGAEEASARCSYTVLEGGEPGTSIRILLVGRYEDRYARGADGWHLTDRLFHVDLDGSALPGSDGGTRTEGTGASDGGTRTERTGVSDGGKE